MEYEALTNAILKVLQVYIKEINLDSTFKSDLGADSIDLVQIFKLVEDSLGIKIKNVNLDKIETVEDALNIIKSMKADNE